ncbi:hypothetical protein H4219_002729 [Mycoemilia scoparia]|uniref:Uncharacterized protein n=1 Tax=Mycoemilia scoparia TaxID=417184 RepID=A0A9W7ZWR5_9FUNG|nr:hypothetical protein H4219_002729 [Mycoemilia scoparia]
MQVQDLKSKHQSIIAEVGGGYRDGVDDFIEAVDPRMAYSRVAKLDVDKLIEDIKFSPCENYLAATGQNDKDFIFDTRFMSRPLAVLEHGK